MQTITVETGVAMPEGTKAKGTGINKYAKLFRDDIKPILHGLLDNQSFLYPCTDTANVRRNLVWYANKYGQTIGKKFVVVAVPTGVRCYCVGMQDISLPTVTAKDTATIGNSLDVYVAPTDTPAS